MMLVPKKLPAGGTCAGSTGVCRAEEGLEGDSSCRDVGAPTLPCGSDALMRPGPIAFEGHEPALPGHLAQQSCLPVQLAS